MPRHREMAIFVLTTTTTTRPITLPLAVCARVMKGDHGRSLLQTKQIMHAHHLCVCGSVCAQLCMCVTQVLEQC